MPRGQHREEATLLFLAALLLVFGVLVYAVDRSCAAYFLTGWDSSHGGAALFGSAGHHLPTFVHSLAVFLVMAAVLRRVA